MGIQAPKGESHKKSQVTWNKTTDTNSVKNKQNNLTYMKA